MNEPYQFKARDFLIPLWGLIDHHRRSIQGARQEVWGYKDTVKEGDEYAANAFGRDFILTIYNVALGEGLYYAIKYHAEIGNFITQTAKTLVDLIK